MAASGGAGVSNAGDDHDADQQRDDQRRTGGSGHQAARACQTQAGDDRLADQRDRRDDQRRKSRRSASAAQAFRMRARSRR